MYQRTSFRAAARVRSRTRPTVPLTSPRPQSQLEWKRALTGRAARPGRLPALAGLLLLLAGCGSDSSGGVEPAAAVGGIVIVAGDAQTGTVNELLRDSLVVRVLDEQQRSLPGVRVSWLVESGGGTITTTSVTNGAGRAAAGWKLGRTAGAGTARAVVGRMSVDFTATSTAASPAMLLLQPSTLSLELGTEQQLQPLARDAYGNTVADRTYSWSSTDPAVASVDGTGRVRGEAGGAATIRVISGNLSASAAVTVTGPPPPAPIITAIEPAVLEPEITATITGANLPTGATTTSVTINGVSANVISATPTQLQVKVPSLAALGCLPGGTVDVAVKLGSRGTVRPHPLRTATPQSLAAGELLGGASAASFGCAELAAGSGSYLIAVYHTAVPVGGGYVPLGPGIRMLAAGPPTPSIPLVGNAQLFADAIASATHVASLPPRLARARNLARRHLEQLEASRQRFAGLRVTPEALARELPRTAHLAQPAQLGDTLWIRYPSPFQLNPCVVFDSIAARVAYVGQRSVVLEDVTAPLARQIDSLYARLADEFDQEQFPIVVENFGDPLAMDAQLNGDGRIFMLFTRRVNNYGAAGFVWPGDIVPRSSCPQSNLAEIFYGMVPTVTSGGGSGASSMDIEDWYWYTRGTVIHEVKHIASTVARLRSTQSPSGDETWLEESLAMVAEEIWARGEFGYAQHGNVGFEESLACELWRRAECRGKPLIMLNHFGFLYDYLAAGGARSVLGPAVPGDATFYGSSWSFVRWAIDQSGAPEKDQLRRLTQSRDFGVFNFTNVVGRSYPELLRDYVLSIALDDRAGAPALGAATQMTSWNLRDIYAGLNAAFPNAFPSPFPLLVRTLDASPIDVSQVRTGSAAFFELTVPLDAARAFQVVAPITGGVLPQQLQLLLLRTQ